MATRIGSETADKVVALRDRWHTKNHPFFLDFAAGRIGVGPVAAMMAQHYQHVRRVLPSQGIAYYRDEPFGVIVAMQSTQEGQQPALNGERMLPGFKQHHGLGIDHPAIEFFAEHYVADADHSSRQIDLVAKLITGEDDAARALDVAETAVRTRWDCITEIYRTAVLRQSDPLPPGVAA